MQTKKTYSFVTSEALWTRENRVCREEDISNAPYYEDLMFEIQSNSNIEPLIAAKDAKYKSDDLKLNMQKFNQDKEIFVKKIVRQEVRFDKLGKLRQIIEYSAKELNEIYTPLTKNQVGMVSNILYGYLKDGMFSQIDISRFMNQKEGFFSGLFGGAKRKQAKLKLGEFIQYCKDKEIYAEFQTDPTGKSRELMEVLMMGKTTNMLIYYAEIDDQLDMLSKDIESSKSNLVKSEHSIQLANQAYDMDNFVLIQLENDIIRSFASKMKEKLFPKPVVVEKPVEVPVAKPVEVKPEKIIKKKTFVEKTKEALSKIKSFNLTPIKNKIRKTVYLIKSKFSKK